MLHVLQVCDAHIASQLQQLASSQTSGSVLFLEQMNDAWQDHCSQMLTIRSIFLYLDRTYVISDSTVRSIFDMGLQLFRLHLATHPEVHNSAVCSRTSCQNVEYAKFLLLLQLHFHMQSDFGGLLTHSALCLMPSLKLAHSLVVQPDRLSKPPRMIILH